VHSNDLLITARQGVDHRVCLHRAELHTEIIAKQFAYPRVLWYGAEVLMEEELGGVVVCAHHERAGPQIRPPVPHRLDEADEFALIRREFGVLWCHWSTIERDWFTVLMKHDAKARAGSIAVDDEGGVEVQQLQGWTGRERLLEGNEHRFRLTGPAERLAFK